MSDAEWEAMQALNYYRAYAGAGSAAHQLVNADATPHPPNSFNFATTLAIYQATANALRDRAILARAARPPHSREPKD